ncbi:MAG: hypothetical protein AAF196_15305 [Planctomycetota bacterium]
MSQFQGSPKHQPPNRRDLEKHPPAGPDCGLIRGLLRDFVDHDLDDRLRSRVEEHVHACRSCSLALARAEHEALLLSDAFADERTRAGQARPRLVTQIVDAVRREEIVESDHRRERRARRNLRPAGVAASVVAVVGISFALALGGQWWSQRFEEPAVFRVETAAFAERLEFAENDLTSVRRVVPLRADDQLSIGSQVQTGEGGELSLSVWSNESGARPQGRSVGPAGTGSAAAGSAGNGSLGNGLGADGFRVNLGADSRLVIGDAPADPLRVRSESEVERRPWQLSAGEFHISSRGGQAGSIAIELGPNGRAGELQFGGGVEAWLSLESVRRPDRLPTVGGSGEEIRARVELLSSDGTAILRRGAESQPLVVGRTVEWVGRGELDETLASTEELLESSARLPEGVAVLEPEVRVETSAELQVVGAAGEAVVGVRVEIVTSEGFQRLETDSEGRVALPSGERGLVGITAPSGGDYASQLAELRSLPARGSMTLQLAAEQGIRGRVLESDGQAMSEAIVVPMVVDELFERVERWGDHLVVTDPQGNFELRGLPAELGPYQVLAVEIVPMDAGARKRPFLARIERQAERQTIQRFASEVRRFPDFDPGEQVLLVETIPGLSSRTIVVEHEAVAGVDGSFEVEVCASGSLRIVSSAGPIEGDKPRVGRVLTRLGMRSGSRFESLVASANVEDLQPVYLNTPASLVGRGVVLLERADGRLQTLGATDFAGLRVARPDDLPFSLTAVFDDGSIARRLFEDETGELELEIQRVGEVLLPKMPDLGDGSQWLRFRSLDEDQASLEVVVPFTAGAAVSVPEGRYQVSGAGQSPTELEVKPGVRVELEF